MTTYTYIVQDGKIIHPFYITGPLRPSIHSCIGRVASSFAKISIALLYMHMYLYILHHFYSHCKFYYQKIQ